MKNQHLLTVKNLNISFKKNDAQYSALHGINFDVHKNEILGLVGESGSGKSITALAIMRLLHNAIIEGAIVFDAQNDIFYEIPTNAVDVVDATGAGDAFAAGFLYGIKNDLSVQECARIGNIFAGFIIKKVGSRFEQEELQQLQKQVK